jgi:alkylhydroperoxidase family enzyme
MMPRIDVPDGDGGPAVHVWSLRPEMGAAVGALVDAAYRRSKLPVRERELARMRIAQLNQCPI